jgi:putative membrane protein insertion efficiency factor
VVTLPKMNFISVLLIGLLRGYQSCISPIMGSHCRFYPTCSSYAIAAIQLHGPIKGIGMSLWRVMRCNPFFRGGNDPVPGLENTQHPDRHGY